MRKKSTLFDYSITENKQLLTDFKNMESAKYYNEYIEKARWQWEKKFTSNEDICWDIQQHFFTFTPDIKSHFTWNFINTLSKEHQYNLAQAIQQYDEKTFNRLADYIAPNINQATQDKLFEIFSNITKISQEDIENCEKHITIPKRGGYMPSTFKKELFFIFTLLTIDHRKLDVWNNPEKYDERNLLNWNFKPYDHPLYGYDTIILWTMWLVSQDYWAISYITNLPKKPKSLEEFSKLLHDSQNI